MRTRRDRDGLKAHPVCANRRDLPLTPPQCLPPPQKTYRSGRLFQRRHPPRRVVWCLSCDHQLPLVQLDHKAARRVAVGPPHALDHAPPHLWVGLLITRQQPEGKTPRARVTRKGKRTNRRRPAHGLTVQDARPADASSHVTSRRSGRNIHRPAKHQPQAQPSAPVHGNPLPPTHPPPYLQPPSPSTPPPHVPHQDAQPAKTRGA